VRVGRVEGRLIDSLGRVNRERASCGDPLLVFFRHNQEDKPGTGTTKPNRDTGNTGPR